MPVPALYALSFLTNAAILVFEIAGGRLLAPYLGTSVGVWAGLIAVVLGGMAIGYRWGGFIADRNASKELIARLLLSAALTSIVAWSVRDLVPTIMLVTSLPVTINAVVVATLLFMPTVVMLAALSPMIAKNLISNLENSARVVGTINAVGTVGSILGAIATGLVFIPYFGIDTIFLGIAVVLFVASLIVWSKGFKKYAVFLALVLFGSLVINAIPTRADVAVADISTAYNRIFIDEYHYLGEPVRTVSIDPFGTQCAMYLRPDSLVDESRIVFDYVQVFDIVNDFFYPQGLSRTLFLGGCNYSYPRALILKYPETHADVVEIDSGMTKTAEAYFDFKPASFPTLSILHEDARIFLNQTHEAYDRVFMDTFGSASNIPSHLTTVETFERLKAHLSQKGLLIVNVIGAPQGTDSGFTAALVRTAREVFPNATLYSMGHNPTQVQNLILVASKEGELPESFASPTYPRLRLNRIEPDPSSITLTDNYAPVERLMGIFK